MMNCLLFTFSSLSLVKMRIGWRGHCTALHCTPLHCTALHCTALHCTVLHRLSRRGRSDGGKPDTVTVVTGRSAAPVQAVMPQLWHETTLAKH
jgi:hypothetical protein